MCKASAVHPRSSPPPLVLCAPLVLAAAAYARVFRGQFQFDDFTEIDQNPAIKDLGGFLERMLSFGSLGGRSLTHLTMAMNYAVGRLDPFGYHLVNFAIHLAAVVVVWAFTARLARLAGAARPEWIAVAVAGAFALHPLQTQAVSYLSQRAESLASALYVAALLLLLEAERQGFGRRGAAAYAGGILVFVLALAAKPIAVTLPAAYALVALALAGGPAAAGALTTWRRRAALATPLVAITALHAASTMIGLRGAPSAGTDMPGLPPWHYLLTQSRAIVVYLRLLFLPVGQSVDWEFRISRSLAEPAVLASAALIAVLLGSAIALVVRGRRGEGPASGAARLAGLGILWFFLVLSVTSSVVPLADVFMEHRAYLASWGILLAVAVGIERLVPAEGPWPRRAAVAVVLVFAVLATITYRRNAVWETRESLWTDAVSKNPRSARAHMGLGVALGDQGRHLEAIAEYEAGLSLAAEAGQRGIQARLYGNLGGAYLAVGRVDDAAASLRQGLTIDPKNQDLLVGMAIAALQAGEPEEAEALTRRALAVAPRMPHAWNLLGGVLLAREDPAGALAAFEEAVRVDPDMGEPHVNRAHALGRMGRIVEACAALRDARNARLRPPDRANVEREIALRCR